MQCNLLQGFHFLINPPFEEILDPAQDSRVHTEQTDCVEGEVGGSIVGPGAVMIAMFEPIIISVC